MAGATNLTRIEDLNQFYSLIDVLTAQQGGAARLSFLRERTWPHRGVYFFFDDREPRRDSGNGPRVVRIGTHALTIGSKSTLAQRLSQHRGLKSGGGNHRGSIFRLLVGQAMIARGDIAPCPSWGVKSTARQAANVLEASLEKVKALESSAEEAVSAYISHLTFVWLGVDDLPGPASYRGYIERNAIALLSNYQRNSLDSPSKEWLGRHSDRPLVVASGLWNQRHIDEEPTQEFLETLKTLIERSRPHEGDY